VLCTLLVRHQNFPSLAGPEQLISRRVTDRGTVLGPVEEVPYDEEQRTMHFLFQQHVIITLCQLMAPNASGTAVPSSTLRVTVRDGVGKYAWDSRLVYEQSRPQTKAVETKRGALQKDRRPPAQPDSRGTLESRGVCV